ncbi:hypothetical protein NIHE141904_27110 [Enterobacter hormaechei]|nr:hypothetical protein NIHE141904_27110 [Enterobacter hormaechei]
MQVCEAASKGHCRVAAAPYPAYKIQSPNSDTNRRPAQAQRRRAQPHRSYPSLIIARNRFTVRERSNRRQQSAISV